MAFTISLLRTPSTLSSSPSTLPLPWSSTAGQVTSLAPSLNCSSLRQSLFCLGLPLTSSPAPLRRGHGKFDYDSAIASPHDIKRALFQSQFVVASQLKKDIEKDERKRRHSQKLLSASAPVRTNIRMPYYNQTHF